MLRDLHLTETALISDISGDPQSSVSFPALFVPIGLDGLIDPMHQLRWLNGEQDPTRQRQA